MTKDQPATFAALVDLIEKGDQVTAAAEGIRALPRNAWDEGPGRRGGQGAGRLGQDDPRRRPHRRRTTSRRCSSPATWPACSRPTQAAELRKELKELRVAVFVVNTVREQMRYDTPRLVVEAGKPFEIIFENGDFMPHNLVVVNPGTRPKVGADVGDDEARRARRAGPRLHPQRPRTSSPPPSCSSRARRRR